MVMEMKTEKVRTMTKRNNIYNNNNSSKNSSSKDKHLAPRNHSNSKGQSLYLMSS